MSFIRNLTRRMSSSAAKILFTEIGLFGDGAVALTVGAPSENNLLKVSSIMSKATETTKNADANKDGSYLQYGPKQGSPRYREQVAKFLSEGYGDNVKSDNIAITSGATHGLHMVGSMFLAPNATIFVEDPTYFIAINILRDDLGLKIQPVPTNDNGIDLEVLEQLMAKHHAEGVCKTTPRKPFSSLVYLVPTYNNPRGYHIPPENNRKLVQIARKYDSVLFCDDVYNLLHFDANSRAPPRLLSYDNPEDKDYNGGCTVSNGTFSKIMGPGLRLGWIEAGPKIQGLCKINNVIWSAGSANHYTSEVVASALELGLEQDYLKELNAEYRTNVAALCDALKENIPAGCKFNSPMGGYFIWIEMPEHAVAAEVAKIALQEYKIKVLQGQMCSPTGKYTNCIRISFSYYPKEVLVDSAKKLCAAIDKHLKSFK